MLGPVKHDPALIERVCGAAAAVYASRKQRGGQSGQKGVLFETAYASYRIALAGHRACLEEPSGTDVWFQSQTGGFVDDLAVVTGNETTLTQAKGGAVAWSSGDHPVADDFRMQRQLDAAAGRQASYELVVSSDAHVTAMTDTRPGDLEKVAVIPFRCTGQDWLGLFAAHPELEQALDTISIHPPRRIVREQTFQAIVGLWLHRGCRGSLLDLMTTLAERSDALVRIPGPDYQLPSDVAAALAGASDLTWSIKGRHFSYAVGSLTGWAAYLCGSEPFNRFERFMVEQTPTDWKPVVRELRREPGDDR